MKLRLDFVTNSSSSCYLLAIAPNQYKTKQELVDSLVKQYDLGPSWKSTLGHHICEITISEIDVFKFGYHDEILQNVRVLYDDRINYLPNQRIYAASIYDYGDEDDDIEDIIIKSSFKFMGNVVIETEGNDF